MATLLLIGCIPNNILQSTAKPINEPLPITDFELHRTEDVSTQDDIATELSILENDAATTKDGWKDAYAAVIRNIPSPTDDDVICVFACRDLDGNGVPELLLIQHNDAGFNAIMWVYSYDDGNVSKIGDYSNPKESFLGGFRFSDNPMFPGLFDCWWGGGVEYYGYFTIKDRKLESEYLWCDDHSEMSGTLSKKEFSNNRQLIDESINIYPPIEYTDNVLEMYEVNDENIGKILTN